MKEQIENAKNWLLNQDIDGVLTGSTMLGYFENPNQDIDIFCYTEQSFTKLVYALHHNPMFLLLEPIEKWKFKEFTQNEFKQSIKKLGLITLKFKYNLTIDVNIIYKQFCNNIFDVLSTFDIDIISIGIDLKTKKTLNLSENLPGNKVTWNKWNKKYYSVNLWNMGQLLRQFERVIKYYNRGYNTDEVALKYREILSSMIEYENIFDSQKVDDRIDYVKDKAEIAIKIIDLWLKKHKITEKELELLKQTIKEI